MAVEEIELRVESYFCSNVLAQLDSGDSHPPRGGMNQNALVDRVRSRQTRDKRGNSHLILLNICLAEETVNCDEINTWHGSRVLGSELGMKPQLTIRQLLTSNDIEAGKG